jgi:hypothetical protein
MDEEPTTTKTQQQAFLASRKAKRRKRFSVRTAGIVWRKKIAASHYVRPGTRKICRFISHSKYNYLFIFHILSNLKDVKGRLYCRCSFNLVPDWWRSWFFSLSAFQNYKIPVGTLARDRILSSLHEYYFAKGLYREIYHISVCFSLSFFYLLMFVWTLKCNETTQISCFKTIKHWLFFFQFWE